MALADWKTVLEWMEAKDTPGNDPVLLVSPAPETPSDTASTLLQPPFIGNQGGRLLEFRVIPVVKRQNDAFQSSIWVGREPTCDVVLPFSSASKLHAQFRRLEDGASELRDVGSTNGTYVEDERLAPNRPVRLPSLCELRFGSVRARFMVASEFTALLTRLSASLD